MVYRVTKDTIEEAFPTCTIITLVQQMKPSIILIVFLPVNKEPPNRRDSYFVHVSMAKTLMTTESESGVVCKAPHSGLEGLNSVDRLTYVIAVG